MYDALYAKGIAVGESNIKADTLVFRWKDEVFEFPTVALIPGIAAYNGYFYEAEVERLRKMKEQHGDHPQHPG